MGVRATHRFVLLGTLGRVAVALGELIGRLHLLDDADLGYGLRLERVRVSVSVRARLRVQSDGERRGSG